MANPIVNTLPQYVDETREELIAKTVLGGKSAKMFSLVTGVKGATALHTLVSDVVLQNASACGFNPTDGSEISQVVLTPAYLKVNEEFCAKNLLSTYAAHLVKISAGDKTLPFEEEFVNDIIANVNEQIEKMIYQGESGQTDQFEGLISQLSGSDDTIKPEIETGSTAYEAIKTVYMAMPSAVIAKSDAVILVSYAMFREFIQDLVAANLYHFSPTDKDGEYLLPGTNVKVVAVGGLDGADKDYIIGARLSNLHYGTDMMGDEETFDLWWSKDAQAHRLAIEFTAGVAVPFKDEVVLGEK